MTVMRTDAETGLTEFALGVAGVQIEVEGTEHLWARRPAVFVFNHQSALDPIVLENAGEPMWPARRAAAPAASG